MSAMTRDCIKRIELKDGRVRFRFVVDLGRDPATGKRVQKTHTFDDYDVALEHRVAMSGSREVILPFACAPKVTVGECIGRWLAEHETAAASTVKHYHHILLAVQQRLGHRVLQRLSEADVEGLVDWMLTQGRRRGGTPGTGLSPGTVDSTLARFSAVLDDAVARRWTAVNVVKEYIRKHDQVYFGELHGFVKIGHSVRPLARLSAIGAGSSLPEGLEPGPVTLLATMLGGYAQERRLHARFAHCRVAHNREWFLPDDEMKAFIRDLQQAEEVSRCIASM